ncbi:type II toxin-antitoxin system Phd/YefM family antitoxin [Reyranella sp.]|uniref:type II toxin-antitoxin system Phd/YefM family antitoxin n=1 Tax=Reyranella sp. TaxID=1929291 RepID=UPI003BAA706B
MSRASRIKPISYFKANAAEIIEELGEVGEPMIITQNGEAKAVVQDIISYEKTQETLALLKILALANRDIEDGRYRPAKDVFADLRQRLNARKTRK